MLVQRFEPQGRRFTNFHYYNYYWLSQSVGALFWWVQRVGSWLTEREVTGTVRDTANPLLALKGLIFQRTLISALLFLSGCLSRRPDITVMVD